MGNVVTHESSQACIEELEEHMGEMYTPEQRRAFMVSEEARRAAAKQIHANLDKDATLHVVLMEISTNTTCQISAIFNALKEMDEVDEFVVLNEEVAA